MLTSTQNKPHPLLAQAALPNSINAFKTYAGLPAGESSDEDDCMSTKIRNTNSPGECDIIPTREHSCMEELEQEKYDQQYSQNLHVSQLNYLGQVLDLKQSMFMPTKQRNSIMNQPQQAHDNQQLKQTFNELFYQQQTIVQCCMRSNQQLIAQIEKQSQQAITKTLEETQTEDLVDLLKGGFKVQDNRDLGEELMEEKEKKGLLEKQLNQEQLSVDEINFQNSNSKDPLRGFEEKDKLSSSTISIFSLKLEEGSIQEKSGQQQQQHRLQQQQQILSRNQNHQGFQVKAKVQTTQLKNTLTTQPPSQQHSSYLKYSGSIPSAAEDSYISDEEDENDLSTLIKPEYSMSPNKMKELELIKGIINQIINSLDSEEQQLQSRMLFQQLLPESSEFSDKQKEQFALIHTSLIRKFRLLKKTKEEKTKFIMRKAFRYLFSRLKTYYPEKMNLKEANEICMKYYFSQHVHDDQFVLPFRRNSSIKTMNAAFLKKVFASQAFVRDYRKFLERFDTLAISDIKKKVEQLSDQILPMMEEAKFNKLNSLRRLPWTLPLLNSTKTLAHQLLKFEGYSIIPLLQQQPSGEYHTSRSQLTTIKYPMLFNKNNDTSSPSVLNNPQFFDEAFDSLSLHSNVLLSTSVSSSVSEETDSKISTEEFSSKRGQQINGVLTNLTNSVRHNNSRNYFNNEDSWYSCSSRHPLKRKVIFITPPPQDIPWNNSTDSNNSSNLPRSHTFVKFKK